MHIHRKAGKSEEATWRCVLELPTTSDSLSLDAWKSVLSTPELRREWDPAVESAQLVEMFDPSTRVAKTMFTLGWPARYVISCSRWAVVWSSWMDTGVLELVHNLYVSITAVLLICREWNAFYPS